MSMIARFRSFAVRTLAAIAVLGLLGAGTARAALPGQDRISSGALLAIGIADTGQFWDKAGALPLTQAVSQYLSSAQMAQNLAFQQFVLQQKKLEQTLGYPATPAEFFKNVFSSLLITIEPAGRSAGKPGVDLVLGIKDKAKAARLVEALDNFNRQAQTDAASAAPAAAGSAPSGVKFTFEQVKVGSASVSHYHVKMADGTTQDGFYALSGSELVYSTSRASLEQRLQAKKPAQDITKNAVFAKLAAELPWSKADVLGWVDSAMVPALVKSPGLDAVMKMVPNQNEQVAFTLQVERDGIVGKVASTENPGKGGLKPRKLKSLGYLAPAPLLALVNGLLDPEASYRQFNAFIASLSMAGAMAGNQGGSIPNPLAGIEQSLGISIQNDLVPALGNEVMVSLNSLRFDLLQGMTPTVDMLIGVEVRDAAKMKAIMTKLERNLEAQLGGALAGMPGATSAADPNAGKFQTIPGAVQIRSMSTGQPNLRPSYALTKGYLLIALSPESIQAALARAAGQQASVQASPAYAELHTLAGTDQLLSYVVVDVKQATQMIVAPAVSMLMLTNSAKFSMEEQQQITALVTQILPQIGTAATIETMRNGLTMGYFKLKM